MARSGVARGASCAMKAGVVEIIPGKWRCVEHASRAGSSTCVLFISRIPSDLYVLFTLSSDRYFQTGLLHVGRCRGCCSVVCAVSERDQICRAVTLSSTHTPQAQGLARAVRTPMPGVQGKTNNEHCKRLQRSQKTVAATQARLECASSATRVRPERVSPPV